MDAAFRRAQQVLAAAIEGRIFPGAVCEVGTSRGPRWRHAVGRLSFDTATETAPDTIYDLASLTKPIATTTAILHLRDAHVLQIDDRVSRLCAAWRGEGRVETRLRDLLEHASGLSARLPTTPSRGRDAFVRDICALPLEYPLRTRAIYSDLGFILLGFWVEAASEQPFDALISAILNSLGESDTSSASADLFTRVPPAVHARVAPTLAMEADARRGRRLVGEVHDDYADLLGGFAGHAGLFGTAPAVGRFACLVLRAARGDNRCPAPLSAANVALATGKSTVPGSSRALGWDTMLPTSSCGTTMSSSAFGHVGFTGTSLWIDPGHDRYAVLLTNRVCAGGTSEQMQTVRRAFHDALS